MKRLLTILLFLSVLSLPSILFAADPIIRTWKELSVKDPNINESFIIYSEIDGQMIEFTTNVE